MNSMRNFNKNQVSSINLPSQSLPSRVRPSSASIHQSSRDPNWMKLFHKSSSKEILKSKPSKLLPYSIEPTLCISGIQPKFAINAISLYEAVSKTQNLNNKVDTKASTLRYIPEFSSFTERNVSLSRISTNRSNFFTSRPSTATVRVQKPVNHEFLPDKGNEFASEVLKIWENMPKNCEENKSIEETLEDMQKSKPAKKTVMLKIPQIEETLAKEVLHLKPSPFFQKFKGSIWEKRKSEPILLKAQCKILSQRPQAKPKAVFQKILSSKVQKFT